MLARDKLTRLKIRDNRFCNGTNWGTISSLTPEPYNVKNGLILAQTNIK